MAKKDSATDQYVYRFNYRGQHLSTILELCAIGKDLYNQAQYWVRNNFINHGDFMDYMNVEEYMKNKTNLDGEINYQKLKAQVSQQLLKVLERDWKGYFKGLEGFKKNPELYTGRPRMPRYKRFDFATLTYTNQCSKLENGKLTLAKGLEIAIPQPELIKGKFCQCRIVPQQGYCTIEIVYSCPTPFVLLDTRNHLSIDMGINNLMSCIDNINSAFLINGRHIKSYNKDFNKRLAKSKSQLPMVTASDGWVEQQKTSKLINSLYESRNTYMDNKLHVISRYIIDYCIAYDIGVIVIGQNKGWKDESSMSKKTNQTFCQIPHSKLIDKITYKAKQCGIVVITNEESYTSKCDALALEDICKHDVYLGKRIRRGLFKSSTGNLINADINGAINILRKVVGDEVVRPIIDMGLWCKPCKITL